MTFPGLLLIFCPPKKPHETPLGWGGSIFLAENESHICSNMCDKFGCGPTVMSKKGGGTDRQSDKGMLRLYIVDTDYARVIIIIYLKCECQDIVNKYHYSYLSALPIVLATSEDKRHLHLHPDGAELLESNAPSFGKSSE